MGAEDNHAWDGLANDGGLDEEDRQRTARPSRRAALLLQKGRELHLLDAAPGYR